MNFENSRPSAFPLLFKTVRHGLIGRERFTENLKSHNGHQHRRDSGRSWVGGASRFKDRVIQRGQPFDATELFKQARGEAVDLVDVVGQHDLSCDSLDLSSTTPTAASPFGIRVTSPTLGRAIGHSAPSQTKLVGRFWQTTTHATTHFGRSGGHAHCPLRASKKAFVIS